MHEIVEVEDWHIIHIAENMRFDDKREIYAQSMAKPLDGLKFSTKVSTSCYTGIVEKEPIVIFGVGSCSLMGGIGSPWLLGTEGVKDVPVTFLKESRKQTEAMFDRFQILENYVDVRNEISIRWLKFLGFDIMDPEPHGPFKLPFHRFRMER